MTSLRAEFIGRLQLKGFSQRTITNYIAAVAALSTFHNRSPITLSQDELPIFETSPEIDEIADLYITCENTQGLAKLF